MKRRWKKWHCNQVKTRDYSLSQSVFISIIIALFNVKIRTRSLKLVYHLNTAHHHEPKHERVIT